MVERVATITVEEQALAIQREGRWQAEEPYGAFQRVLRCLHPLVFDLQEEGFLIDFVLRRPMKIQWHGGSLYLSDFV
jgi:hypothetical protein